MKAIYSLWGILFLCLACSDRSSSVQQATSIPKPVVANEDDLVLRLSAKMIAAPKTRAEKEKNTLLNYAIDHLLDVQETPSGLFYQIVEKGKGAPAKWGDYVTAHYKGYTLDGKVFDSSYARKEAMQFYIGNMIVGWNEGLALMNKGSKAFFLIPSHLAYGDKGVGKSIKPHTPLIFEVALLNVEQKE